MQGGYQTRAGIEALCHSQAWASSTIIRDGFMIGVATKLGDPARVRDRSGWGCIRLAWQCVVAMREMASRHLNV